jgi:cell division transport system ATP-binding protein
MIQFNNVTAGYPKGARVLDSVDFHIDKGEFVFLTGPSGSGKSTLLKLIYQDLRPLNGEVCVAEFSSKRLSRRKIPYLRRKLGIVFQDFGLLESRTAGENVAFALEVTGMPRSRIRKRVSEVMEQMGLAGKERCYPLELSGGEQQRVAIARALVGEPFVLIADEPTGNLDPGISREILMRLEEINAMGMAVLMATHDYTMLQGRDHVRRLHLSSGRLIYDGPNGGFAPDVTTLPGGHRG